MKKIIALWFICYFPYTLVAQESYNPNNFIQYIQNQDYKKAIEYLQTVTPGQFNKDYYLNLGYAYFMNEEEKNALPAYRTVYEQDASNLPANLYLAIIYQRMKKYGEALQFYKNLTVLQPDQYKYWFYTSSMFSLLELKDSAFAYIEKAYSLNPSAADVVLRYSSLLSSKKETKKAVALIDDFLKTDSTNDEIIAQKISNSAVANKYSEVIFWGERLRKDSANQPLAYMRLAYAYLNTKKLDECLELCNWMDLEGMKSESTIYCAAMCYAQKKDFEKSNQLLDECLKLNLIPQIKTYFRGKANNYEQAKAYTKAILQYDSCYYIFGDAYDLYYKAYVYDVYLKNKNQASVFKKKRLVKSKVKQKD